MQETLFPIEQLFTDLMQKQQKQENAEEAFQIKGAPKKGKTPGAAKVAETSGAAKEVARITVETVNEPDQLNEIFEFEEAAKIDPDPEKLNEIFEVEEAAQIDPDPEQLNEIFQVEEATQIDPEPEQLNEIFEFKEGQKLFCSNKSHMFCRENTIEIIRY